MNADMGRLIKQIHQEIKDVERSFGVVDCRNSHQHFYTISSDIICMNFDSIFLQTSPVVDILMKAIL